MARPKKNPTTGDAGATGEAGAKTAAHRRTRAPTLQARMANLVQATYKNKLQRIANQLNQLARGG